mmetsp:Transcript_23365/g.53892  ORF Transcript_23365/g.53892 Transcript_23365/m.53892 type:complete len:209 (+) Transcript_23365:622-1248(+)
MDLVIHKLQLVVDGNIGESLIRPALALLARCHLLAQELILRKRYPITACRHLHHTLPIYSIACSSTKTMTELGYTSKDAKHGWCIRLLACHAQYSLCCGSRSQVAIIVKEESCLNGGFFHHTLVHRIQCHSILAASAFPMRGLLAACRQYVIVRPGYIVRCFISDDEQGPWIYQSAPGAQDGHQSGLPEKLVGVDRKQEVREVLSKSI